MPPVAADDPSNPDAVPSTHPEPGRARRVVERFRTGVVGVWRDVGRRRWLRWPLLAIGTIVLLGAGAFALLWATVDFPPAARLGESAVLLDRNGNELAVLSRDGSRMELSLAELPDHVPAALLAAEDRRFYDHSGLDVRGILRAAWNNVVDDDTQGGSTLTQQLVKNVYLDADRTFTRKAKEAVLSFKLERKLSKDEILERYLNTVYFGRGAYGVESAARAYFGVSATDLGVDQGALLIGILRSPASFDPIVDPGPVLERRDAVLTGMVETGALDEAEAARAMARPLGVLESTARPTELTAGVAPHFVEAVRAALIEELGEAALYRDGLRITTTLDLDDQRAAEAAVAAALDDPEDPQAALVAVDGSGAVRAWVGGRDFEALQLDLVSHTGGIGRQPGSTFKPITLAANLAAGHGAGERYGAPSRISLDVGTEPWVVENAGGRDYGTLTLAEATYQSVNTVYAQAVLRVGPDAVAELASDLGVTRPLDPQPSIALGTEEVSPLEMATVYSTFARRGQRIDPFLYTEVRDAQGKVRSERDEAEPVEVLSTEVADTVNSILQETPRRGTARAAALDRPMAAKTGTTQRSADAWLAGYTPNYTAIVWVGNADSNEPIGPVDGQTVFGGTVPAQIWKDFMTLALEDVEEADFPPGDPELLGDTGEDATLVVLGGTPRAGGRIEFGASGLRPCVNGWHVVVHGPMQPAVEVVSTPRPEEDSKDEKGNGRGKDQATEDVAEDPAPEPIRFEGPVEHISVLADEVDDVTAVDVPERAPRGVYEAVLVCDSGSGGRSVAATSVTIDGVDSEPSTTTTSSTTTSTSTTTTTSSTTPQSSSTTSSTTTTTTAPQDG